MGIIIGALADAIDKASRNIQKLRWQTRLATGFNPASVSIPKRYFWKGKVDRKLLTGLKNTCGRGILKLAKKKTSNDT